jgi:hypothetical protein
LVANADLLADNTVRQRLTWHSHANRTAACGYNHLIALANCFGWLHMDGRKNLVRLQWSRQFFADGLVEVAQIALIE